MDANDLCLAWLGNLSWGEGLVLAAVIGACLGLRLRRVVYRR